MVRFDDVGLAGLGAGRFDHVRVDGALGQPAGVGEFGGLLVKDFHEQTADDLALLLGVGHTRQFREVTGFGIHPDDAHTHMFGEGGHHLIALVLAQQAGIHEDADELVANRTMQKRRHHGRIDAAGQAQDDLILANFCTQVGDAVVDDVSSIPQRFAATNVGDKPAEQALALPGVGHLGVELERIEIAVFIRHAGNGGALGRGNQLEAGG